MRPTCVSGRPALAGAEWERIISTQESERAQGRGFGLCTGGELGDSWREAKLWCLISHVDASVLDVLDAGDGGMLLGSVLREAHREHNVVVALLTHWHRRKGR